MIDYLRQKQIMEIWENHSHLNGLLMPSFINVLPRNHIIFIGMNPSFSDKFHDTVLKKAKSEGLADFENWVPSAFYSYPNIDTFDLEKAYRIEQFIATHAPYFKDKFDFVSGGLPWAHMDLFFYRKTNQKESLKFIFDRKRFTTFGQDQLNLSWGSIKQSQPKVIIISNATAGHIVRDYSGDNFIFNEQLGYHEMLIKDRKVPVFFTSMLSGKRALDLGSLERLAWHVRQVTS